ncbi:MAG TPA: AmmeMemoRadiSam system radical SAM enzyme [Lachnospiraceae bacterium]|nr:AmmeMemoRadiSam system radical SAM enzyme [Lachnospiraceae bacterium]
MMAKCDVCFRHCVIAEGKLGFCGARTCRDGKVVQANYGRITSLALDPIEKKPLNRFYPGSLILSAGSYGCNLRCPFCQNYEISWSEEARKFAKTADVCTPEDLARAAAYYQNQGNIGIAFTYNEPLIGYEFILDTAKLIKKLGMKTVLVTNGTAELKVLEKLAPYIDAMNIDLKGFTDRYYREVLKGDRKMVMDFIARAAQVCHVEVTTLIIPGENDSEEEMDALSSWIAGLTDERGERIGQSIPLHISRFFPRFHMQDRRATEVRLVYRLAEVARRNLTYVYTGNC